MWHSRTFLLPPLASSVGFSLVCIPHPSKARVSQPRQWTSRRPIFDLLPFGCIVSFPFLVSVCYSVLYILLFHNAVMLLWKDKFPLWGICMLFYSSPFHLIQGKEERMDVRVQYLYSYTGLPFLWNEDSPTAGRLLQPAFVFSRFHHQIFSQHFRERITSGMVCYQPAKECNLLLAEVNNVARLECRDRNYRPQ
jgi:hypothetical protein